MGQEVDDMPAILVLLAPDLTNLDMGVNASDEHFFDLT
jgi:hypothetical protein